MSQEGRQVQLSQSREVSEHYRPFYDAVEDNSFYRTSAVRRAHNIASLCKQYPHDKILDIGCGNGLVLKLLSELSFGREYHGLEIVDKAVESTLARNIPGLIECNLFNGYDVPHGDKMFDLAVLCHVLEHIEFPRRLLYEAARVAKYVFVEVPLEDTLLLKKDYSSDQLGHINFYSAKTIRSLLQTSGFNVLVQQLSNRSLDYYRIGYPKRGILCYAITEIPLRVLPPLASKVFTYNCSLLCSRNGV